MAGSSVVSFGYWAAAGALAVAIGVGMAWWHEPTTIEVPLPDQRDAGPQPPLLPAPPTRAGASWSTSLC